MPEPTTPRAPRQTPHCAAPRSRSPAPAVVVSRYCGRREAAATPRALLLAASVSLHARAHRRRRPRVFDSADRGGHCWLRLSHSTRNPTDRPQWARSTPFRSTLLRHHHHHHHRARTPAGASRSCRPRRRRPGCGTSPRTNGRTDERTNEHPRRRKGQSCCGWAVKRVRRLRTQPQMRAGGVTVSVGGLLERERCGGCLSTASQPPGSNRRRRRAPGRGAPPPPHVEERARVAADDADAFSAATARRRRRRAVRAAAVQRARVEDRDVARAQQRDARVRLLCVA